MTSPNGRTFEERKEAALQAWLANPMENFGKIAEIAGIGRQTFYRYRNDPEFMAEYKRRCRQQFAELEAKAVQLLSDHMDSGEWQPVKYALDALGYKPVDEKKIVSDEPISITVGYTDEDATAETAAEDEEAAADE